MKIGIYIMLTGLILSSCLQEPNIEAPSAGSADFIKVVVVGDSYTSGFQNGALSHKAQEQSLGALIVKQIHEVSPQDFRQAFMPDLGGEWIGIGLNSKPWESSYVYESKMGTRVDCEGTSSLGPVKASHTASSANDYWGTVYNAVVLNDFSIPEANLADLLSTDLDQRNAYYDRIDNFLNGARPIDVILDQDPSFFIAWLGMEDVYRYARNGGYQQTLPTMSEFSDRLDSIVDLMMTKANGGVLATIPHFSHFPYYTLIPYDGAELTLNKADSLNDIYSTSGLGHIVFQEGDNGFIIDDSNAPNGVRQMLDGEYITISVPLDSMKCEFYGILFSTIHSRYVLDTSDVSLLNDAISNYNTKIRQKASEHDLALVEMESVYSEIGTKPIWDGVDMSLEFVTGNFFSLDGYHAHTKGQAYLANEFIKAINLKYGATISPVNGSAYDGVWFP